MPIAASFCVSRLAHSDADFAQISASPLRPPQTPPHIASPSTAFAVFQRSVYCPHPRAPSMRGLITGRSTRCGKSVSPCQAAFRELIMTPGRIRFAAAVIQRETKPRARAWRPKMVCDLDELDGTVKNQLSALKTPPAAAPGTLTHNSLPAKRTHNQASEDREKARRRIQRAAAAAEAAARSRAVHEGAGRRFAEAPTKPCWTAQREKQERRVYGLDEIKALGMRVIHWDGRRPLVDSEGRVLVLQPRPRRTPDPMGPQPHCSLPSRINDQIIPSALIRHSNTPISETEMCYSFAQYSAGGPFRWVENEFQTEEPTFLIAHQEPRLTHFYYYGLP
ncbi:hypothetical protein BJ912DRAFT_925287 [Pholiota molesta]|nr:hypothetical protein BJ912DRAFT_925287 [Pholiota molesta]